MNIYDDCCTQAGTSCVCIPIYHDVVGVHFPHFMALACFVLFGFMFVLVCRKKTWSIERCISIAGFYFNISVQYQSYPQG